MVPEPPREVAQEREGARERTRTLPASRARCGRVGWWHGCGRGRRGRRRVVAGPRSAAVARRTARCRLPSTIAQVRAGSPAACAAVSPRALTSPLPRALPASRAPAPARGPLRTATTATRPLQPRAHVTLLHVSYVIVYHFS